MKKKAALLFSLLVFAVFLFAPGYAAGAKDAGMGTYFIIKEHVPYISGYGNDRFGPNNTVTRAEAAQMLYNLLLKPVNTTETRFEDAPLDKWYGQAVNALAQIGIFKGYEDGTFRPDHPITRAELVTALTACVPQEDGANPFSDLSSDDWAYSPIVTAVSLKWVNGYPDGTFRPRKTITRAEAVVILNRALQRTGEGFAENRTGKYFTDIEETNWAYLDIVEASGATALKPGISTDPGTDLPQIEVTASSLNMRSGPGTNFSVLVTLSKNTLLHLTDKTHAPWLHVKTQDGTEGYVHADYVADYIPSTLPAKQISLSSAAVKLPQYKSLRLDGVSTPATALVWSSSDEDIVTISTIRYSEGDESCIVYGKSPGTVTVTCRDYAGTVQAKCTVTVQAPEPVRFAFTEPHLVTTKDSTSLIAITDPKKTSVRFTVEDSLGNSVVSRHVEAFSAEQYRNNKTNVFRCPIGLLKAGKYSVQVYSAGASGVYEKAEDFSFTVHTSQAADVTTNQARDVSDKMIQLIMEYEDYVPLIRDDGAAPKHPTVGYGLVINTGESFYNSMTRQEAKALLIEKINRNYGTAVNSFREKHDLKMSQSQYDALVSFAYNLGPGYMDNPSGNNLFTSVLNAIVPPDDLSVSNPCPAVLNVKNADLYASPSGSGKVKGTIQKGTRFQVIGMERGDEMKELWYLVKIGSDTGWMRGGNIRLDAPFAVHDLSYVDSMTFALYLLGYHHTDICEPGLLYRRLREAKLFLYGDYEQASPSHSLSTKNTYGFIYPDCMKSYEGR